MLSLNTIETDLTRVDFVLNTLERIDLKGGKSLDEIKIFSKLKGGYIEKYKLNYDYSQAVTSNQLTLGIQNSDLTYYNYRLKLNNIEKKSNDSSPSQKWLFIYNPQNLPSRRSFAQDHWGFFNGSINNTTLLPPYYYSLPDHLFSTNDIIHGFFPPIHELGGNREGNEVAMKAEILTDIVYPTGGKTSFEYEANSIPANEEKFSNQSVSAILNLTALTNPYVKFVETPFTIPKGQYVRVDVSNYISPGIFNDRPDAYAKAQVICVGGGCILGGITSFASGSNWINLRTAGNYVLQSYTNVNQSSFGINDNIQVTSNVTFSKSDGFFQFNKLIGGLRIKSIQNYDLINANATGKRYFEYADPLVLDPVNIKTDNITEQDECKGVILPQIDVGVLPTSFNCSFNNVTRSSSTKFATGSNQGSTVSYGQVTTKYGANSENGKSISIFSNALDINVDLSKVFPYPPPESREWRRGLLLKETNYSAGNVPINETINTYDFTPIKSITAYKAGFSPILNGVSLCSCLDLYSFCNTIRVFYSISTEQLKFLSTKKTVFSNSGLDTIVTISNYYYDNPNNLNAVRTETKNSKGIILKSLNYTPLEKANINSLTPLTAAASLAIDSMLARNIISPSIEQVQYVNDTITNIGLTNYKLWGNNIIAPENIQIKVSGNPIETRLLFNKYDVSGNLAEQQKVGDIKHIYLYDYKNTYPIAEITNADSASVAYTSFEADGLGNWVNSDTARNRQFAITGSQSYSLITGKSFTKSLTAGKAYIVSYWSRNGAITVLANGVTTTATPGLTKNSWTYYEHLLPNTTSTVAITATSAVIDELRLYPSDAQMLTYTYTPLIGVNSVCSANNNIIYYEYDGFNRLKLIRDMDKNIVKQVDYQYQTYWHANPVWQTITGPYCETTGAGNTGNQITIQKDVNPSSLTFGNTNTITVANTTACPVCNSSNCIAPDSKCINGVCQSGTLGIILQKKTAGQCETQYGYFFSDNTYLYAYSTFGLWPCE